MVISEFQITLIAAGAGLVVVVWLYNLIQERKHRKAADSVFKGAQKDVLLESGENLSAEGADGAAPEGDRRLEPAVIAEAIDLTERVEPVLGETEAEAAALAESIDEPMVQPVPEACADVHGAEPGEALADKAIELILPLTLLGPVTVEELWHALDNAPARCVSNTRWIGFATDGWQELQPNDGRRYINVRAALQLADRQGPATQLEIESFIEGVRKFADLHASRILAPAVSDVLVHARALDEFCASIDIQMSIHVISRSGAEVPCTKLRGIMEANGFILSEEGVYLLKNEIGSPLLSVRSIDGKPFVPTEMRTMTTYGITFWLDVPRTPNPVFTYDKMLTIARQISDAIDGILVDDQRHPLQDSMLAGIRGRIQEIQQKMNASELPAGGRRALRLFRG